MPRDLRANERQQRAAARRSHALGRADHIEPGIAREAAAGPMSPAIKSVDQATRDAIAAFMARREGGQ